MDDTNSWIPLWFDKELFPVVKNIKASLWRKLVTKSLPHEVKVKLPEVAEVAWRKSGSSPPHVVDDSEVLKLSERLEALSPTKAFERINKTQSFKQLAMQVEGTLYYPFWAPHYIKGFARFYLALPDLPADMRSELEVKLQLPDHARQHDFKKAMEEVGSFSFERYSQWAESKYPDINRDFEAYVKREKFGMTTEIDKKEFCIPHFGHPSSPELFVHIPAEAREYLPSANASMHARIVGLTFYTAAPVFPTNSSVFLRVIVLLGGLQK